MNKMIPATLLGLLTIVVVGSLAISHGQSSKKTASPTSAVAEPAGTSSVSSTQAAGTATTATYKDGSYSADGSYTSPDGNESIGVTLAVAANKVTSVTVTPKGPGNQSMQYEQLFAHGISSVVVGKTLGSQFDVSEVNGSSLTGNGFNAALQSIRSQAKS